jgi:hypothetical protein
LTLSRAQAEASKVLELCAREATMIFGGNALMMGGVGDKIECSVAQVKAYVSQAARTSANVKQFILLTPLPDFRFQLGPKSAPFTLLLLIVSHDCKKMFNTLQYHG